MDAGRLMVEADETGRIVAVAARSRPAVPVLTLVDLGLCRVDGTDRAWSSRDVAVDTDEIGVHAGVAGTDGMEASVRHSFSTGWTTRLLLVNHGSRTQLIDRLQLAVRAAPGQRASGLVAGSRLCWALQATDGQGPLLAVRLAAGAVTGATVDGLELGPLRLGPGQRYVTQLRWELYATPRSVVAGPGRDVLVSRTVYQVGESVLLPDDPDAALVVPRSVAVEAVEEPEVAGREVSVAGPGRHRVELRSAEGDVRLDLGWVRPLTDQLGVWAAGVLAGPRTAAGVVAIDDLVGAIVVQAALGAGVVEDADQAGDALDRLTARLVDRAEPDSGGSADPFEVLYLLGEHGRSGDPDVLDLALTRESQLLAQHGSPPPGAGLALLRTVVVGADAPERVAQLVSRAVERATADLVVGVADEQADEDVAATDPAARLELLLAVRPLLPDHHPAQRSLITLVRRLGAALGAGLPGRLLAPPPVAVHAHLVAVLRMLPEDGIPGVTRTWGSSSTMLAHRLTLEVLDRLTDDEVGPAAAWLSLVPRPA